MPKPPDPSSPRERRIGFGWCAFLLSRSNALEVRMAEVVIGRRVETVRILTARNNAMSFKMNFIQRDSSPPSPIAIAGLTFVIRMEDGIEWVGIPHVPSGSVIFAIPAWDLSRPVGSRYRGGLFISAGGDEVLTFRVIVEAQ